MGTIMLILVIFIGIIVIIGRWGSDIKSFFVNAKWKKHFFKIVFALISAALGFIIMNNKTGGKILGAVLFFFLGLGVAKILEMIFKTIKCKPVVVILEIIVCILLAYFAFTRQYGTYKPDRYESDKDSGGNSGGFIGSDGEYHPYIPEFGDDVNDWMEDNW